MKAIIQQSYGSPDVFELKEIDKPAIKENEVLVRIHAASLHAGDVFAMRGEPYLVRLNAGWPKPKNYVPGLDMAGCVEAVGANVTQFQLGDEVFGEGDGACAEYTCARADRIIHRPDGLTPTQAAAVPTSALSALQGLRDAGKMKPGQAVLINGASGGVGTYAVQIAKAFGAEVTGVCSTSKMEMVRSIGADHVIDYNAADFTRGEQRYDLILDQAANHSLSECRSVLTPQGIYIPNSGHSGLGYIIKAFVTSLFVRRQGRPYLSMPNQEDLLTLVKLIDAGNVTPVIDRSYPLDETSEAFRYLDDGRAQGKVVIAVAPASN